MYRKLPFNEMRYAKELGAPMLFGETGYRTLIAVSAYVQVEVSVKIIFFTIHLSFHTSIAVPSLRT